MRARRTPRATDPSQDRRARVPETMRIRLLGGFSVTVGSRTIRREEWRSKRAASLLKLLALAPSHRMHRERAKALLEECLMLCRTLDNKYVASGSLEGLACIAADSGQSTRAAKVYGAASKLRETVGYKQPDDERELREPYLVTARSRLGKMAWEAAIAEGRAMTFEEAFEYALSTEPDPPVPPIGQESQVSQSPGNLSPREQEVATLAARGLTNRQVSTELSISERTAANHVAKILKKLGLASRAQIAAWAAEHDQPTPHPD